MRGGLAWIDASAAERFGKDFVACTEARAHASCWTRSRTRKGDDERAACSSEQARRSRCATAPTFFNSFRDLTASGFWSSKIGVEDLGYVGNTFAAEWEGPPAEVLVRLGVAKD